MPAAKLLAPADSRLVLEPVETVPLLAGLAEQRATAFDTELGYMAARWRGGKLARLSFGQPSAEEALEGIGWMEKPSSRLAHAHRALVARLRAYARGARDEFSDVPVLLEAATPFVRRVIVLCREIGYGSTLTYGQLAARAGSPGAARAVGNVMAANRIPLVIPCHRVVGASGALGGFSAPSGASMKRRLLELEGSW